MVIGILKERFSDEQRVALSPAGVEALANAGIQVMIETDAGKDARFTNDQYEKAGATIVYSPEEATRRAEIVLKVMPPMKEEYEWLGEGQTLMSFLLLGMAKKGFVEHLLSNNITAMGYEFIKQADGSYPILRLMSEISGQIATLIGARYLRSDEGGRGVLLGGMAGVAPAAVVILGAGFTGFTAAQSAIGLGAQVIVMDHDLERLRRFDNYFGKHITTVMSSPENLRRGIAIADVFIGAISVHDDHSNFQISEEMVMSMKPGAVLVDVSIDQGGCAATSRPTTINDPVYTKHGVVHYCVPNMPSIVARTATYALTNAVVPYLLEINGKGLQHYIEQNQEFRCGVITHEGKPTHPVLTEIYGMESTPIANSNI
jgi:alanine dehydrogenase